STGNCILTSTSQRLTWPSVTSQVVETTSILRIPRTERAAAVSAWRTASSELSVELPITSITFVTAIRRPPLPTADTVAGLSGGEDSYAGADHAGGVAGRPGRAGGPRAGARQRPVRLRRGRLLPDRPHRRGLPGDTRPARPRDRLGRARPHRPGRRGAAPDPDRLHAGRADRGHCGPHVRAAAGRGTEAGGERALPARGPLAVLELRPVAGHRRARKDARDHRSRPHRPRRRPPRRWLRHARPVRRA